MAKRKRNVDAENHLLNGGLITGFLTFMGFLPGAAASAAVTATVVKKDIDRANKQEAFKKDFAAHQVEYEKSRLTVYAQIDEVKTKLRNLADSDFSPNSENYILQEKLEKVFVGAKEVEGFYERISGDRITVEEMLELASTVSSEYKEVYVEHFSKRVEEFVIRIPDKKVIYTKLPDWKTMPYNVRKLCNKWNIPFRKYSYDEIDKHIGRIACEINKPYQFDYSKYR